MAITAEQCVAALGDALASRPTETYSEEAMTWFADVAGIVAAHDGLMGMRLNTLVPRIGEVSASTVFSEHNRFNAVQQFFMEARTIYTTLRLQTNAFTTAQLGRGQVFDYFEEIRRLIAGATSDVLFIDRYLDAEFVERYLPQIPDGVSVRLLTSAGRARTLGPVLSVFRQQYPGAHVQLRTVPNQSIHDRHLVVDQRDVWQSGASFQDGAKHAPTTINQIVDVASALIAAHEETWSGATVVP